MSRRSRRPWLAAAMLLAVCGRSPDDRDETPFTGDTINARDTTAVAGTARQTVREPAVPNGSPMPPAEEAGGIPPYPNAIVHVRRPRPATASYVEAFTTDPWEVVVDYYERRLTGWTVTRAADTVIFEKTPDRAAVTVQPWDGDEVPPGAPDVLVRARTAIGAAWR